jgi:hypothetical protein
MNVDIEAAALRPGDVVVGPFNCRTVEHVDVHTRSIHDDDPGRRFPGVVVHYTDSARVIYRLDALLTIEPRP